MKLQHFIQDQWIEARGDLRPMHHAATGALVAETGSDGIDFAALVEHGKRVGGPALRAMTIHQRARMVKALAAYLNERKDALYALNPATGATQKDGWPDIDGGITTMFVISSKARREMPDKHVHVDGPPEQLSRNGTFLGQHIYVPRRGVVVQINAFNFPVWGMLEKLAPSLIAGVPSIVKPATPTAFLTERLVHLIAESGILPPGALQFFSGSAGDLLSHLDCQDVVAFTGSAATAHKLSVLPGLREKGVQFVAETDSLNGAILGPDASPDSPEFDLFVKEVAREMTVKAGQKCTAIRRAIVPAGLCDAVVAALKDRLSGITVGNPANDSVRMGALVDLAQRQDVREKLATLAGANEIVLGDPESFEVVDADREKGAFLPPILLLARDGGAANPVHAVEAFGPVSTVVPYGDLEDAIAIANRGEGSLVSSVFTHDTTAAAALVGGIGAYHGRLYVLNRDSAKEGTGHGSPMPHLVHGGPGRAGGGEELGGIRGILHFMQRTAVQGSPDILTGVAQRWLPGAQEITDRAHPFTRHFDSLDLGETFYTQEREVTLADIEHFAAFTGDTFYAHMDEAAAKANPFFDGRVAHGYLLLSFAAGLFVQPDPGPVLANTGLDNLRFMKPVYPGERIHVRLVVKDKTPRTESYGEVRWDVTIYNADKEVCANYDLLTMSTYAEERPL